MLVQQREVWLKRNSMYQMKMERFGKSLLSVPADLVPASPENEK